MFDADTELSPRMTPSVEGFLVCRDAMLARCGEQEYFGAEIQAVQADANGWIIVSRPESEVFDPASLRSYVGEPVVLSHHEGEDQLVHSRPTRILTTHRRAGMFAHANRAAIQLFINKP
jgi:hypothetical protein